MTTRHVLTACAVAVALAATLRTFVIADAAPEMRLPPGWTEADMQACMLAATPGKMHEHLAQDVGQWQGKNTMWMFPGADPVESASTTTITSIMDGRFIQCEVKGETPGFGPFTGLGLYGYDNVAKKFTCVWIDNHGTGMMHGLGELSDDGQSLTWTYAYHCPVTGKPATMRQVETVTGPGAKTMVMYAPDPKTGEEFKMLSVELTRK